MKKKLLSFHMNDTNEFVKKYEEIVFHIPISCMEMCSSMMLLKNWI